MKSLGQILYRIGEAEVKYAPIMSGLFAKAAVVGGAGLTGYGIGAENIPWAIAGLLITPMGLAVDKAREVVIIETERREAIKNLEAAMEDDGLPF